jgi:ABC-type multidrug transport system ATPase subunit
MLVVDQLSKKFHEGEHVLKNISFSIRPGETAALIGASGSGKSTLIGAIIGIRKYSGTITIKGQPLSHQSQKKDIGFVHQENLFDEEFSCLENLMIYGSLLPSLKNLKEKAHFLLKKFDLIEKAHTNISELSGGMKRRLAVVRALLSDPKILILDEFSTGLDPNTKDHLWDFLEKLQTPDLMILFVSHDMEEVKTLAQKILVLKQGELISQGSLQEVCDHLLEREIIVFDWEEQGELFLANPHFTSTTRRDEGLILIQNQEENIVKELENLNLKWKKRKSNLSDLFSFFH